MIYPRPLIAAAMLFVLCGTQRSTAQSDLAAEPFEVHVAQDGGYARCGPSHDSYRTEPLDRDQPLTVYLQTQDGWLGVQPLPESFCWIPADAVNVSASGQTGRIIEDRTASWIGTHLNEKPKHQWQVKLAAGESVTIIGQSNRQGPDGPQLWYRIVPPSGEYRWVHRDQVIWEEPPSPARDGDSIIERGDSLATPENRVTEMEPPVETIADQLRERGLIALFGFNRTVADRGGPITPTTRVAPATRGNAHPEGGFATTSSPIQQTAFPEPSHRSTIGSTVAWEQASLGRPTLTPTTAPNLISIDQGTADRIAQIRSQTQGADVEQLTLLLSKLMAREASAAEMQPVIEAARELGTTSPSTVVRSNELLERAQQYAELANRREATRTAIAAPSNTRATAPGTPIAEQNMLAGATIETPLSSSMTGRLVPVYSVRADSPSFALTDGVGRTVAYVQPAPGMNLRNYVNTNVTVSGKLTHITGIRTPVVVAIGAVPSAR